MRKLALLLVFILALTILIGCTTTQKGATMGGLLGAGMGAIIGHQSGHIGEGALIGGGVGAITGALIGSQLEEE